MAVQIDAPQAQTQMGAETGQLELVKYSVTMVLGSEPDRFVGHISVFPTDGVDLTTKAIEIQKIAVKKAQAIFDGVLITDAPDSSTPN